MFDSGVLLLGDLRCLSLLGVKGLRTRLRQVTKLFKALYEVSADNDFHDGSELQLFSCRFYAWHEKKMFPFQSSVS